MAPLLTVVARSEGHAVGTRSRGHEVEECRPCVAISVLGARRHVGRLREVVTTAHGCRSSALVREITKSWFYAADFDLHGGQLGAQGGERGEMPRLKTERFTFQVKTQSST